MARPTRTPEQLVAASKHLHHELAMMDATGRALASGAFGPGAATNAFLESFAIHARCLVCFFFPRDKPEPDDVVPQDFVSDPTSWPAARGDLAPALVPVKKRVGKEIAHLTYGRLDVTPKEKRWDLAAIREALLTLARSFADDVPPERLDEAWKPFLQPAVSTHWRLML